MKTMTIETARARAVLVLGLLLALGIPGSVAADGNAPAPAPAAAAPAAPAPADGPVFVGPPSVPTLTRAARDLPEAIPDPHLFLPEAKRRDDYGFSPIPFTIDPKLDPLLVRDRQRLDAAPLSAEPDGFGTLVHDYAGQTSTTSPPDTNGDVGPNHYVQGVNLSVSTVRVFDKATGQSLKTFELDTLTTASPCRNGFCDSIVLYDRQADRWILTELPSSGGNVCMYVSTSGDPTGTYYAYTFAVESSLTDFPKYGVWPLAGNAGSYLMGANAGSSGRDVFAFDRAKMLQGLPATFQKFTVPNLPNSGFQLVLPAGMQGNSAPPAGEPAIFMRPYDDEAQVGATTPGSDFFELWSMTVDWATPANSRLTKLPNIPMADYDMTLCGLGGIWNCMPQPDTGQKIDPIREPIHFPLHYRILGSHQAIVGAFVADVNGTDQAAVRWFELRKPLDGGGWTLFQEGLIGGEPGVHRAVAAAAMDGQGNIAVGYTRTGAVAPYYPSIYYKGRLVTDPPGTCRRASTGSSTRPTPRPTTSAGETTPGWASTPWTIAPSGSRRSTAAAVARGSPRSSSTSAAARPRWRRPTRRPTRQGTTGSTCAGTTRRPRASCATSCCARPPRGDRTRRSAASTTPARAWGAVRPTPSTTTAFRAGRATTT